MRRIICAIAFAVSVGAVSVATGVAAPIGRDAPQAAADYESVPQQVQYNRCDRLRRACEYKDERGERGEGNCRRYREECGGGSYCDRLRRACEYKDERGERGEGNCRRYRQECR